MVRKFLLLMISLGLTLGAYAQGSQINGTVKDASGAPIMGATVSISGTSVGTTTDGTGSFVIPSAPRQGTLVVAFIGYETLTEPLSSKTTYNFVMAEDATAIDEVMVVAYGTQSKASFTGSASVVDSEKIGKIQSASALSALEGSTSGVQIVSSSGQPGSNPTVLIRGIGSINASNTPLYIVDGATYDGNISAINASDIESMTVLKDAAASALYGSRGANGVILITTKKGNKSDLGVTFDAKVGINSRAVKEYDLISDPGTYYEQVYLGQINRGYSHEDVVGSGSSSMSLNLGGYNNYDVPWSELIGEDGKLNPDANLMYNDSWEDEMFSNAVRQEYNVSLGKSDASQSYYMSLGYLDEDSYSKYSGYQRYTGRLRYEKQVTDWFKMGGNLSYAHTDQSAYSGSSSSFRNFFMWSRMVAPIYPVYLRNPEDGSYVLDETGNKIYDFGGESDYGYNRTFGKNSNPLGAVVYDNVYTIGDAVTGAANVEFKIIEGLTLTGNYDTSATYNKNVTMYNPTYGDGSSYGGILAIEQSTRYASTASSFLNYHKQIGLLDIDVLAGAETYNMSYNYLYGEKMNLTYTDAYPDFSNAVEISDLTSYTYGYSLVGLLSRVNLGYDGKYFLSGSYRRDGSSRFHEDNRWGNFGSVGASWIISNEAFMQDVDVVDMLRVKGSYGSQGNDKLLNSSGYLMYTPYQDQYEVVNNGGEISLQQSYVGNPDITWEKNHNFNVGFDLDLLQRVNISAEYFSRVTTDMLFNTPVAVSTGVSSIPENIGSMKNSGFEAMIGVDVIKTKDLVWNVSANFTHVKNVILELPDEYKESGIASGYRFIKEGGSIYDYYLPEYVGVNEEGYALYNLYELDDDGNQVLSGTTTSGSEAYTTKSRTNQGTSLPDLQGGFSTSLSWKGLDFSAVFSYQIGGHVYDSAYATSMGMSSFGQSIHVDMLDAWSADNTGSDIPMLRWGNQDAAYASNRFWTDASYLNIRNITLGYTLPKSAFGNTGISSMRVYVAGDNLALWSARQGLDPRQYASGATENSYSPIRTVSVGLNLTL